MKQCPPLSSASDPLDYYRQKKIFCNDAMELENDAMELEHDEIALRVERLGETRFRLFIVGKTKRIMRVVTLRRRKNGTITLFPPLPSRWQNAGLYAVQQLQRRAAK